jgi:hypothetical protein
LGWHCAVWFGSFYFDEHSDRPGRVTIDRRLFSGSLWVESKATVDSGIIWDCK